MKIVFEGKSKKGNKIIIRYPSFSDLDEMLRYINKLSDEKTFIRYQGEHETQETESKYLESRLEAIVNKKAVHLLVFSDNNLIAASEIRLQDKTERHIGILGITVVKEFRGQGIGKLLMELVLKEAEKEIKDLKIITLQVYSTNPVAKKLYVEFGFVEYGRLPNGIFRKNAFEDTILMHKNIK